MKWYLASRTKHLESLKQVSMFLESAGETVVSDWMWSGPLKPFEEHIGEIQRINIRIVEQILEADVFVLISDPAGTDMFVELGIALAKDATSKDNRIYIVGEHAKRSLMQLHPAIVHAADLAEVFMKEGIVHEGFTIPEFHHADTL